MKLDSAVVKLLALDPHNTSVSSHGGAGMSSASTMKITTTAEDGSKKQFFMKTGKGSEAELMFTGEHASLNAVHNAVPSLCPASFGHGALADTPSSHYLVTEFMDLSPRSGGAKSGPSLAQKLAKLHTTPAPTPPGHEKPMFGFPATTCCGDTPQDNTFTSSWATFYAEHRLRFILARSEKSNGSDKELSGLVNRTADEVVPRLIGDEHLNGGKGVVPVVIHGDLWSGNAGRGRLPSMKEGESEDVVFDPSACYAHNEFELGIMKMFGGFGGGFLDEYHSLCPRTEPQGEYSDRIALYELYHHLNHHALFGGGYRSGAVSIMKGLLAKYGSGSKKSEL
ncbi:hypothetical protein MBLNU457_6311t2 [Dothideomycetes sp. NU457]